MSCSDGLLTWIRVQFSNRRSRKSNNTLIWSLGLYMISAICDRLHWIDADASNSVSQWFAVRYSSPRVARLSGTSSKRSAIQYRASRAKSRLRSSDDHRVVVRPRKDSHTYYHYTNTNCILHYSRMPVFRTLWRSVR